MELKNSELQVKSHKFIQDNIFKLFELFTRFTIQTIQILNLIFVSALMLIRIPDCVAKMCTQN